jgi:phosphatidyl-myo-inositol alpha-mannosyltransferase
MRIALLQPSYWPEVERGTERIVHDIGAGLAKRGHDVTLITSHPAPTARSLEDGIRVIRARRPPRPAPLAWYEDHIESTPVMLRHLLRGRFDVANAFVPSYAWAAGRARRFGGPPVVFSFHGIPDRSFLIARRHRIETMRRTAASAAATTVLSDTAATAFRRYLLTDPVTLPAGYFRSDFAVEAERAPVPTLVCAADLRVPRKRGELLLSAFRALHARRPEVRLVLVTPAGKAPPIPATALPDGAEWLYARDFHDILRAYGFAWASVLAAVGEALGLVMIESLAAGTPVVAAKTGAGPEVVRSESIGRLFETDDEADLVRALGEALELGRDPATADTCRERATEYEWDSLLPRYEDLYRSIVDGSRPGD